MTVKPTGAQRVFESAADGIVGIGSGKCCRAFILYAVNIVLQFHFMK